MRTPEEDVASAMAQLRAAREALAVGAHESLTGAINNLKQVAAGEKENADALERRLRKALRALRETLNPVMGFRHARAAADEALTECSVGLDLDKED